MEDRNGQDGFVSGENLKRGRGLLPTKQLKMAREREFPAKFKKLNISETVQDSDTVIQNHSYKVVCALPESASTLELRRHLAENSA